MTAHIPELVFRYLSGFEINRLILVTFKNSSDVTTKVVKFTYDAFNRRIGKQVNANPDVDAVFEDSYRYVYDSDPRKGGLDDIVLIYDDSGNLISRNLHGPGLDNILAVEDASGETHWAHTDHLGSVRDWATYDDSTDTTTLSSETNFDSYGIVLSTTGTVPDLGFTYGYTGQEWDADIGLSYYYNGWYDPSVGRFVSEDPIGFAGGDENLSRYVSNSSTIGRDPSGLQFGAGAFYSGSGAVGGTGSSISIAFPVDSVTTIAEIYNDALSGHEITVDPSNQAWLEYYGELDSIPNGSVSEVVFSGHGSDASLGSGSIRLNELLNKNSLEYAFLKKLGTKLTADAVIDIRACNICISHDGYNFIQELANLTNAEVHAYDDICAIKPHGYEYVATPNSPVVTIIDYHGDYRTSKVKAPKKCKAAIGKAKKI